MTAPRLLRTSALLMMLGACGGRVLDEASPTPYGVSDGVGSPSTPNAASDDVDAAPAKGDGTGRDAAASSDGAGDALAMDATDRFDAPDAPDEVDSSSLFDAAVGLDASLDGAVGADASFDASFDAGYDGGLDAGSVDAAPDGATGTLSIAKPGVPAVAGRVFESTAKSIDCGASCSRYLFGTEHVTLHAEPAGGYVFDSWQSAECSGGNPDCTFDAPAGGVTLQAKFRRANYVFVTDHDYTASALVATGALGLGSSATDAQRLVAGADATCTAEAGQSGLGGTKWRAWLSSSTVDAVARFAGVRGWVRPDGRAFLDRLQSSPPMDVLYPPMITATGLATESSVLTGSTSDGHFDAEVGNCIEPGTSTYAEEALGSSIGGTGAWSLFGYLAQGGATPCRSSKQRLYCLEADFNAPVVLPSLPGRMMFVSSQVDANKGLAAFDAVCTKNAAAASLAGSYRALVATSTATALSRFTLSGAPIVRPDHVVVARSDSALLQQSEVTAAIDRSASNQWAGGVAAWIGSSSPTQPGRNTCGDWSTHNAMGDYADTRYARSDAVGSESGSTSCYAGFSVYCLQE